MAKRRRRRSTTKRRRRNPGMSKKSKKMLLVGGLLGLGFYIWKKRQAPLALTSRYEDPISIRGLSNYVTPDSVSGMGYDVARGADAFGEVNRADYAYDDTF